MRDECLGFFRRERTGNREEKGPPQETDKDHLKLKDAKLFEKIAWEPFDKQGEILSSFKRNREIVLAAGTRFGKSSLCAYLAIRELLKDDKHIWIVAPTYDLTKKIFAYVVKWVGRGFPELAGNIKYRPFPRIETPWGSWIEGKSARPGDLEGLLGEELDLAILDEAARMKEEAWTGYIYDRLTSRRGRSVKISTPFGRNWFYREFVRAKNAPDGASFHFETRDNPFFPKEEWEKARGRLPEDLFNQNYRAMFLRGAASFFRGVDDVVGGQLEEPASGHYYTMGVDWAKLRDYTVVVIIDRSTHRVVHFDRWQKIPFPLQEDRVLELSKRYRRPEMWMDTTGLGEPISDSLKRKGMNVRDFKFTNKSKQALINKLSIFIENGRITIPPLEILLDELKLFGMEMTQAGNIKYGAPPGMHDDCVDALALATWPLRERPVSPGETEPIVIAAPSY